MTVLRECDMQDESVDATATTVPGSGKKRGNAANLRPWQKGVSGNPSGRSKKFHDIQHLAKAASPRAFARIIELVESSDERISFMAAKEVCDRAWGKAVPASEDGKDGNVTINIVRLAANEEPQTRALSGPVINLKSFSRG